MSRELKFRAWDKFNEVFYYSDKYKNLAVFFLEIQKCIDAENGIVIEQCTGLNDMNGLEIYEGDLLKRNHGRINRISFHFGEFEIINKHTYPGSLYKHLNDFDCLVAGNKHQNADLLDENI